MDEQLSFEEALGRLEKIVGDLQRGGLALEESIALFEEGMSLVRTCTERLNAAELKITQLHADVQEEPRNEDEDLL